MMLKSQHPLEFDLWPISPRRRSEVVTATKYWMDLNLPCELSGLSMTQLTAVRKLVVKAYNDGRKAK